MIMDVLLSHITWPLVGRVVVISIVSFLVIAFIAFVILAWKSSGGPYDGGLGA